MCTVWEGQNFFPEAWSTLKTGEESQYSNDWSSHFIVSQPSRTRGFFFLHKSDIEQHALLLSFVCQWNTTPTDWSCHHLGLPMWASRLWGHRVRYVAWRCAVTVLRIQRPAARQSPLCNSLATCLQKTNPISWGLAREANCPTPYPKALEPQKEKRKVQTPNVVVKVDKLLGINLLVNLVWILWCFHPALINLKHYFPGY